MYLYTFFYMLQTAFQNMQYFSCKSYSFFEGITCLSHIFDAIIKSEHLNLWINTPNSMLFYAYSHALSRNENRIIKYAVLLP